MAAGSSDFFISPTQNDFENVSPSYMLNLSGVC